MTERDIGLKELKSRLTSRRTTLGITSFKVIPTTAPKASDFPCVVMSEGTDIIFKKIGRSGHGFPAQRSLEVTFDIIAIKSTDIKALHRAVRKALFSEQANTLNPSVFIINERIGKGVFINENRSEGPYGYGVPDSVAMQLILDLIYTDKGFTED